MPQKSILQSYSAVSSSVVLLCLVIVFSLAVTPSIERPSSGANSPVDLQSQATPQVVSAPPEFKYLPANSKAFVSLKVLPWLPLYRLCLDAVSADKDVTLFYGKMMEDGISQEFGIPLSHIDRVLVVFVADSHDTLTVIGTKSPVTPDDIRQTRMIRNAERSLPYRLHNAGQHTIYQEVYIPFQKIGPAPGYINGKKVEPQTKNAEPKEGDAFCIAEKNVVLFGKEALLRRILTMEQPSKLPTSIQLAIDKLDFSKPLVAAGDVATLLPDGLPPSSPLRSSIKMPRDAFSRIQVITLEAEITDAKVSAKAVLHCGSKKTAEEIKTWANEITKLLPEKLNEGVDGVPLPKAIQVLFRTSIANLTTDVSNGSLIVSTHNDTNGLAAAFWATTRLGMQANHTWSRDDLRESTKRLVSEKTKDEVLTQLGIPHETVELAGFQVWLFPNRLTEILSTGGEKDYSILIVFKNGRVIAVSFF